MKIRRSSVAALALVLSTAGFSQQQQVPAGTQAPPPSAAQALPSLAPLVDSVKAAVVNVDVTAKAHRRGGPGGGPGQESPEDLYDRFFGGGGQNPHGRMRDEPVMQGMGSGFIIDPKGLILTNNHVVEGAVSLDVRLDDGRKFDATIVGRDPLTDVAVIQIKGKVDNLPFVKLGDSESIRPGDWVLAIGNPFGLASSVSLGIVSAKARNIQAGPYDDFIQTDAAINPGNSGGPLFNLQGEVVGINTAIIGGGAGGIGFAVPSNLAKAIIPMLEKEGVVSRGYLGVNIQNLTADIADAMGVPVKEGAIVLSLTDDSPAKKAGLRPDDVIVSVDGQKIPSGDALTRMVALKRPGSASTVGYYRGTKKQEAKITLGTRPDVEQLGLSPRGGGEEDDAQAPRQKIGIAFQDMDPRFAMQGAPAEGAIITEVVPGSPADRAELMRGMVVVEANKKPVKTAADLLKTIRAAKAGSTILLRVRAPGGEAAALRVLTVPQ